MALTGRPAGSASRGPGGADRPGRAGGRGARAPPPRRPAARRARPARGAGGPGRPHPRRGRQLRWQHPSGARARRVAGRLPGPPRRRGGPARLVGPRRDRRRPLADRVRGRGVQPAAALDEQAALLGLPFAAVGSVGPRRTCAFDLPVGARRVGTDAATARPLGEGTVVDLSSLWAGPLCGQLLAAAGAACHQGGVDRTPRRRPPWSRRVLRPAQRREALGGPGPDLGSGRRDLRAPHCSRPTS